MKKITFIILSIVTILSFVSCGQKWTCDYCEKTWTGDAYYGSNFDDVLCEECAHRYWNPLPYKNYKK